MPHLKGPVPQAQAKEGPMPQLVKKRRSGWAVLAAGALVASLFAVGAAPAAAQPVAPAPNHTPDVTAHWDACVGAAGPDGDSDGDGVLNKDDPKFPDLGGIDADVVKAINCIAYYGITKGKGDGSYAPREDVSAFQMGYFVRRTADLIDANLDNVDDLLKRVFPGGESHSHKVTRVEMAELMFGLLDDLLDWVQVNDRSGNIEFDRDGDNKWVQADDFFADARREVPNFQSQVIGASYELGVTSGVSGNVSTDSGLFKPSALVTRDQMATFIARVLDHSNLRPAGLTIQRNLTKQTMVSYRDSAFDPIVDARVDIFSALYDDEAFDEDDGECEVRYVRDETPSHSACVIDIGDELTDSEGNIGEFTLESDKDLITATCSTGGGTFIFSTAEGTAADRTYWAWTGFFVTRSTRTPTSSSWRT